MTDAITLARTCYTMDAAHGTPTADGHTAYAGWASSAAAHGDQQMRWALDAVDADEFAREWDRLVQAAR
jgi:hypothetical protein